MRGGPPLGTISMDLLITYVINKPNLLETLDASNYVNLCKYLTLNCVHFKLCSPKNYFFQFAKCPSFFSFFCGFYSTEFAKQRNSVISFTSKLNVLAQALNFIFLFDLNERCRTSFSTIKQVYLCFLVSNVYKINNIRIHTYTNSLVTATFGSQKKSW